jgi:hypothetical protein
MNDVRRALSPPIPLSRLIFVSTNESSDMGLERLLTPRNNEWDFQVPASDRYFDTAAGVLTLIGLSYDETQEFTVLNTRPPEVDQAIIGRDVEGHPQTASDRRWLELYQKHETARRAWLSERAASVW